jgi:hypothetical protein
MLIGWFSVYITTVCIVVHTPDGKQTTASIDAIPHDIANPIKSNSDNAQPFGKPPLAKLQTALSFTSKPSSPPPPAASSSSSSSAVDARQLGSLKLSLPTVSVPQVRYTSRIWWIKHV